MLIASLVTSLISLCLLNLLVAKRQAPYACIIAMIGIWIPGCLMMPVMLQHMMTVPCFALVPIPRVGRKLFAIGSGVAYFVAYYLSVTQAVKDDHRLIELREKYPFESVEARLPLPPKPSPVPAEWRDTSMSHFEKEIDGEGTNAWRFKNLHEERVSNFVNSPGFGVARGAGMMRSERAFEDYAAPMPIAHPIPPFPSSDPAGEIQSSGSLDEKLVLLHRRGVLDFVNPQGFGYVKSKSQVSGYRPHRFREVPAITRDWSAQSVELVGVLVHDEPAVYLSEHLPRMDQLNKARTRPLDAFETEGLAALEKGEDLFVRGTYDTARMMGAIRNARQCVECHGGSRGDLLGAFSYRLKKPAW
jgi:hypothetical protein